MNEEKKLVNILEGEGTCDDCGRKLRYVYETSDGGHYGSECVRKYIQPPRWVNYNPKADSKTYTQVLDKARKVAKRIMADRPNSILFIPKASLIRGEANKYGLSTDYTDKDRIAKFAAQKIIDILLESGWTMKKEKYTYNSIEKFHLTPIRSN